MNYCTRVYTVIYSRIGRFMYHVEKYFCINFFCSFLSFDTYFFLICRVYTLRLSPYMLWVFMKFSCKKKLHASCWTHVRVSEFVSVCDVMALVFHLDGTLCMCIVHWNWKQSMNSLTYMHIIKLRIGWRQIQVSVCLLSRYFISFQDVTNLGW